MAVQHSLEISAESCNDDGKIRTGTVWTCIAHIITGVIGSGVLSLAWSTAQMGWIAGPFSMLCFALITYISAFLLSDCYRSPHPVNGARNYTYMDAVRLTLGQYRDQTVIIRKGIAPHAQWLSVVAAMMSFTYSFIGFGLGLAKVIGNGMIKGGIGGVHTPSTAQKVWRISQAIGDIAFAYPYSVILIEIQDTLKSPPPENKTMKNASMTSVMITTFFYLCCGCFGYAAFGEDTPGNLLTGFGFYEPYWLIDFANACVILHLIGGYQVFSQPIFAFAERWFSKKFPSSCFVDDFHTIYLPFLPPYRINLLRICFRTLYVASTTGLALGFPYFNQFMALLGAMNFWPLAIYFPVEMYFVQRKIRPWTSKWVVLQVFSVGCFFVNTFALVGSIEGIFSQRLK